MLMTWAGCVLTCGSDYLLLQGGDESGIQRRGGGQNQHGLAQHEAAWLLLANSAACRSLASALVMGRLRIILNVWSREGCRMDAEGIAPDRADMSHISLLVQPGSTARSPHPIISNLMINGWLRSECSQRIFPLGRAAADFDGMLQNSTDILTAAMQHAAGWASVRRYSRPF